MFGIHCQGSKRVPKLNLTQGLKKTAGGGGVGRVAVMVIIPVVLNHQPPPPPLCGPDPGAGAAHPVLGYQERQGEVLKAR